MVQGEYLAVEVVCGQRLGEVVKMSSDPQLPAAGLFLANSLLLSPAAVAGCESHQQLGSSGRATAEKGFTLPVHFG